jgi:cytochrome c oxidase cbb3-type subunit 3/ubiquinol-cytochrome c reductase cytochrome c subunit
MQRRYRFFVTLGVVLVLFLGVACRRKTSQAKPAAPASARGAELYGRMCAVCHGPNGEGYKADEAPKIANPDFLGSATDEFLRTVIANGRTGSTMSAWAVERGGPLSSADITELIKFMRGWSKKPKPVLDHHATTGDAARGEVIYNAQCLRCHGARGQGGPNIRIGNADFLATANDGFLRYAISKGRAGTQMAPFADKLTREQIDDVIVLLRSWQAPPAVVQPSPRAPLPLGPVPLNPKGPAPVGFKVYPTHTNVDVVKAQLDRGARMAILDARAPSDYMNEHIAGSVSVPFYDPSPYFDKLPKNTWLVCYCACPHAESGMLADKLKKQGFSKVTVLNEGLVFWKMKGYPVQKGKDP